ncbi:MAG: histidine kinase dimerization/phosphoacceptor domain -containing protein, partial [Myxococcota bacterium]
MSSTFVAWLDPLLAAIESGQADGVRARISQLEASNLVGLPLQLGPVRVGTSPTREGWFAIHVWPAATGVTPCFEGCVVEVSSWQKAADLVPRLERELHHRAKNSLQLASSLLAIEWDQTEEESCRDILRQVQARVSCISRVHEQLFAQASLTDVDFSIVAQNLAEELRNSIAPRLPLQVDASPVELDYERAIPAAILCSELFAASLCHLRQRDEAARRDPAEAV